VALNVMEKNATVIVLIQLVIITATTAAISLNWIFNENTSCKK
jgi:hypothetical protein